MTKKLYTRIQLLTLCKKAGMPLWNNSVTDTDFKEGEQLPTTLEPKMTPEQFDELFTHYEKDAPFKMSWQEQQDYAKQQGRAILSLEELLVVMLEYWKKHKKLPYQQDWWWLRCRNLFDGRPLDVYCFDDSVDVFSFWDPDDVGGDVGAALEGVSEDRASEIGVFVPSKIDN